MSGDHSTALTKAQPGLRYCQSCLKIERPFVCSSSDAAPSFAAIWASSTTAPSDAGTDSERVAPGRGLNCGMGGPSCRGTDDTGPPAFCCRTRSSRSESACSAEAAPASGVSRSPKDVSAAVRDEPGSGMIAERRSRADCNAAWSGGLIAEPADADEQHEGARGDEAFTACFSWSPAATSA